MVEWASFRGDANVDTINNIKSDEDYDAWQSASEITCILRPNDNLLSSLVTGTEFELMTLMRKPTHIEEQRGLDRLREEIAMFALSRQPLARIEAFTRVMKRYRAVLARAAGIRSFSQQLEKDIYNSLEIIANRSLWMEMWRTERTLRGGTKPPQTVAILAKLPAYLDEMRRVYP